ALLLSSVPDSYLERASALDRLTARQSAALGELQREQRRLGQQRSEARTALAELERSRTEVARHKRTVERKLAEARRVLASLTAEERAALALQRRNAWQRRLAVIALGVGCLMMFVLAGIAAWLSFGAQREYAHAHNGGDWDAATGFALLLDAGALSLSLIRFFEALTLRSSAITRILLLAFVSASAAMNLLHAPGAGVGSAFLAVVPPLVYAILLEMLLYKIEQVIMGRQKRRKADQDRGYSLLLWLPWPIGAPVRMWKAWRSELLATVDNVRVIGSQRPRPSGPAEVTVEPVAPVAAPAEVKLVNALAAGAPP
ncbi:DUF4670 domain-containing protein, partial [Streptomyces sp. WAC02707]|uniref:DUF4670 domain-containing protein n=1 Tax=Streptomyces sp. WAC02707 TaxID=2487417 RepID=UPI0021AFEAC1